MAREDFQKLGFFEKEKEEKLKNMVVEEQRRDKEDKGFVAGSGVKRKDESKTP